MNLHSINNSVPTSDVQTRNSRSKLELWVKQSDRDIATNHTFKMACDTKNKLHSSIWKTDNAKALNVIFTVLVRGK